MKWTEDQVPSQTGKLIVVTGANTGIGYETARALAAKGARVVLACRNLEKGQAALQSMLGRMPSGSAHGSGTTLDAAERLELLHLDLASLDSVRRFASSLAERHRSVDVLINNAGVMFPPASKTEDGFELQFGVNHLGHYAVTGLLLPMLRRADRPRVVSVSSLAHRGGRIDFGSFRSENGYNAFREYAQSKLACLMFALELHRRYGFRREASMISVAAHPGGTATDLQRHQKVLSVLTRLTAMKPAQGSLPLLFAATAPEVKGGEYFGPDGPFEIFGHPGRASMSGRAQDEAVARRLWEVSEELSGVVFT
ncbi:MAG: oxidoreductase [Myxococcota bacterium]